MIRRFAIVLLASLWAVPAGAAEPDGLREAISEKCFFAPLRERSLGLVDRLGSGQPAQPREVVTELRAIFQLHRYVALAYGERSARELEPELLRLAALAEENMIRYHGLHLSHRGREALGTLLAREGGGGGD